MRAVWQTWMPMISLEKGSSLLPSILGWWYMLAELIGKKVTVVVSEASSLPEGSELAGRVLRLSPESGPGNDTGVVIKVSESAPAGYAGALVTVTARHAGNPLEDVLVRDLVGVNFHVEGMAHKRPAVGIGTMSLDV